MSTTDKPRALGCLGPGDGDDYPKRLRARRNGPRCQKCGKAYTADKVARGLRVAPIPKVERDPLKDENLCLTPECLHPRHSYKRTKPNGEVKMERFSYCKSCRTIQERAPDRQQRKRRNGGTYYKKLKTSDERFDKVAERLKTARERSNEHKDQEWEKTKGSLLPVKGLPRLTSKLGLEVYTEVFKALAPYNIKFKAEFNYLGHRLYKKGPDSIETGLRADLLVEVQRRSGKPLTIVIEAQGNQHRPFLLKQMGIIGEQIDKAYAKENLDDSHRSLLLNIIQQKNMTQLHHDLAKLLMSIKQGFVHIIAYDKSKVEEAITDALQGNKNLRVYYPDVEKNAVIDQFIKQMIFPEGRMRPATAPCTHFEYKAAFTCMRNGEQLLDIPGDAPDHEENENMADEETTGDQREDRARIRRLLEKIDPKYLALPAVENLTIDFTKKYTGSVAACQPKITSSVASSNPELVSEQKCSKKRAHSDEPSSDDDFIIPKKKKSM